MSLVDVRIPHRLTNPILDAADVKQTYHAYVFGSFFRVNGIHGTIN